MMSFRHGLFLALSLFIVSSWFSTAHAGELKLALANSTCDAMEKVVDAYRANNAVKFTLTCKSSGMIAKGLRGGALTADMFVSADREWMDFVIDSGLVKSSQVSSPWGNALIVAVPKNSPIQRLAWEDLATDKVATILIGDPSTAPFGRYAKEALENSGLWEQVKNKIQTRKNIELLADSLATSSGNTVGILFGTNLTNQLRQLHVVKKSLHKPIRYYIVPLNAAAGNAEITGFLKFMHSNAVKDIFKAEGFDVSVP